MEPLVMSALRAVGSLFTPGMFGVFVMSILVTIFTLTGFVVFSSFFFSWLAEYMQDASIAFFLPWLGSVGSFLIAWLLFPMIMPVIISFFDGKITRIIEGYDYPASVSTYKPAFWPELLHDLRFSGVVILLNILVLPLYFLPVINLFLFYVLNGYLLGREFFVMSARRHMPVEQADALRKKHGRTVMVAGILLAILATIPIANLFAPFWGVAVMAHLFHALHGTPPSQILVK